MLTTLIIAIGLMGQQPVAKPAAKTKAVQRKAERRLEEQKIRILLEGKARKAVTPGEILFVGPPPGQSTMVALTAKRGCNQMMDVMIPSPGNQFIAAKTMKGPGVEYTTINVPFKVKAVNTAMYNAVVLDAVPNPMRPGVLYPPGSLPSWVVNSLSSDGFVFPPIDTISVPITSVMPLEGPLKDQQIWVLHANFYLLSEKVAKLSYQDRVRLWETLATKPMRHKKTRAVLAPLKPR
jgi:hypothetical protein